MLEKYLSLWVGRVADLHLLNPSYQLVSELFEDRALHKHSSTVRTHLQSADGRNFKIW